MNFYTKGNNAYRKASVTTESQGTLIIMLYDGAIRFLKSAMVQIDKSDLEKAHGFIVKAKNIVAELMGSLALERGGKVAHDLYSLYIYMFNRLIDANIQKNRAYLEDVCKLLEELREGWQVAVKHKRTAPGFNGRRETKPIQIQG